MMDSMQWGAGMMIVMSAVSVAVIAAIVVGVVFLIRTLSRQSAPPNAAPRAMGVLDERFARGEIDRDEYESKRNPLSERRT